MKRYKQPGNNTRPRQEKWTVTTQDDIGKDVLTAKNAGNSKKKLESR
jgi:hypothetical protein